MADIINDSPTAALAKVQAPASEHVPLLSLTKPKGNMAQFELYVFRRLLADGIPRDEYKPMVVGSHEFETPYAALGLEADDAELKTYMNDNGFTGLDLAAALMSITWTIGALLYDKKDFRTQNETADYAFLDYAHEGKYVELLFPYSQDPHGIHTDLGSHRNRIEAALKERKGEIEQARQTSAGRA